MHIHALNFQERCKKERRSKICAHASRQAGTRWQRADAAEFLLAFKQKGIWERVSVEEMIPLGVSLEYFLDL